MSRPFASNRPLQLMLLWLLAAWVITAIQPLYPRDWLLENLLVFVCAAVLIPGYRRFRFSNLSYGLLTVFLTLHMAGAHYTYAETPLGFWLQDWFGFERNHYDRIVHFSFGLLLVWPLREYLLRRSGATPGWSYLLAVVCVMAMSATYENLEMITALIVSPDLGAAYLGTQGDEWDAQKDSALASGGAILTIFSAWMWERWHGPRAGR
jgi:putative membrane protein